LNPNRHSGSQTANALKTRATRRSKVPPPPERLTGAMATPMLLPPPPLRSCSAAALVTAKEIKAAIVSVIAATPIEAQPHLRFLEMFLLDPDGDEMVRWPPPSPCWKRRGRDPNNGHVGATDVPRRLEDVPVFRKTLARHIRSPPTRCVSAAACTSASSAAPGRTQEALCTPVLLHCRRRREQIEGQLTSLAHTPLTSPPLTCEARG
jgi:hypothetical protein